MEDQQVMSGLFYSPRGAVVARSVLWLGACLGGCVGSGDLPIRVSGQIVDEHEAPLGPGLVLVESGQVHAGTYVLGTPIDEDGRWELELPAPGAYGLHLFRDRYQYLPAQIEVEEHQQVILTSMMIDWGTWMDLTGEPAWPSQPTDATLVALPPDDNRADDPQLLDLQLAYDGPNLLEITAEVFDPDEDLSRMVLAWDVATGASFALNPPGPVGPDGLFPNGTYTAKALLDERHEPGVSEWWFVVSDNTCNDTDILKLVLPTR